MTKLILVLLVSFIYAAINVYVKFTYDIETWIPVYGSTSIILGYFIADIQRWKQDE